MQLVGRQGDDLALDEAKRYPVGVEDPVDLRGERDVVVVGLQGSHRRTVADHQEAPVKHLNVRQREIIITQ